MPDSEGVPIPTRRGTNGSLSIQLPKKTSVGSFGRKAGGGFKRNNAVYSKPDENKKVIFGLLEKLQKRKRPPPLMSWSNQNGEGITVPEEIIETVIQLRDTLAICDVGQEPASNHNQSYENSPIDGSPSSSPSRSRSPGSSHRSFSPSPSRKNKKMFDIMMTSDEIFLEKILDMVSDLVQYEGRYPIAIPKLTRPPFILQSVLLDLAQLLIERHAPSPRFYYQLGINFITALYTFKGFMYQRLLLLYHDTILPHLLPRGAPKIPISFSKHNRKASTVTQESASITITLPEQSSSPTMAAETCYLGPHITEQTEDIGESWRMGNRDRGSHHRKRSSFSSTYSEDLELRNSYASICEPVFLALLHNTKDSDIALVSLYHSHRLIDMIITNKPDVYNNILNVVAYGSQEVRYRALQILFQYWEHGAGHLLIAEPLPKIDYTSDLKLKEKQDSSKEPQVSSGPTLETHTVNVSEDWHDHEYYPHLYLSDGPAGPQEFDQSVCICTHCLNNIEYFGVRCHGCGNNVHYSCYNAARLQFYGEDSGKYHTLQSIPYSYITSNPRLALLDPKYPEGVTTIHSGPHKYQQVNTLCLLSCSVCLKPLWGISHQGYHCEACGRLAHLECIRGSSGIECNEHRQSHTLTITQKRMQESFVTHYSDILLKPGTLNEYSYEELVLILDMLRLQKQLFDSSIMSGYVVFDFSTAESTSLSLPELDSAIALIDSHLIGTIASGTLGSFMSYFFGPTRTNTHSLIFSRVHLIQMTLLMKYQSRNDSAGGSLLQVYLPEPEEELIFRESLTCQEAEIWIRKECKFHSNRVVKQLLQSMSNFGFLEGLFTSPDYVSEIGPKSINLQDDLDVFRSHHSSAEIIFPIPYVIEPSPTVEILLSAIESCLSDIDLSVNECGFLLLTRRCWPHPIMSHYCLEHLTRSVLYWLYDEDNRLSVIHLEYTSKRLSPPGVRQELEEKRLLATVNPAIASKYTFVHSRTGGGAYVTARRGLKDKYIYRWLKAIHSLDKELYSRVIYQQTEIAEKRLWQDAQGGLPPENYGNGEDNGTAFSSENANMGSRHGSKSIRFENFLDCFFRLKNNGLVFSCYDRILAYWFEDVLKAFGNSGNFTDDLCEGVLSSSDIKALQRLLNGGVKVGPTSNLEQMYKNIDPSNHLGIPISSSSKSNPGNSPENIEESPITIIQRRFAQAKNNTERMNALDWLRVLITGGASVPNKVFTDLCQIMCNLSSPSPVANSPHQRKSPDPYHVSLNATSNLSVYVRILQMIWKNAKYAQSETSEVANILLTINKANYDQICTIFKESEMVTSPEVQASQAIDGEINTISIFMKYNLILTLHILGCPYDKIEAAEILPVNGEMNFHNGNSTLANESVANRSESDKAVQVEKVREIMVFIASYSEHSKLNIHVELIKALYLITNHNFGEETGLTSRELLHPKLLKVIWELMSPNYDYLAEFSLSVFMRTIKLYPDEFHAFVKKIFNSEDWETRYKNLDNGFGIFFKTTRDFETLYRDSLYLLGPVYNYCVASLWDKNQNVCSKGLTIARSMRSTNQQNALKVWEMYFAEEKSVSEKTKLIQHMIRLNAAFPGLQVFDWEPLTFTLLKYDTSTSDKVQRRLSGLNIIGSYPQSNTSTTEKSGKFLDISNSTTKNSLDEIENLKASLMTLALQMLGNSVRISSSELVRLKSAVVIHLGFEDCKIDWQAPKNKEVTFGALPPRSDWNSHTLLNVFVFGIKRVLDNVPLAKKTHRKNEESSNGPVSSGITGSIGPEILSQSKYHESHSFSEDSENSSDSLVPGTWFVDVILKMFISCTELYTLPTVMLKSWLELMLIIVNKYELDESVIPVMRRITEIVSIDINDENKQLAIAVCYSLLKKPGKLSALLLSKQIVAMGKLLCKARDSPHDIAALKAKEFLRAAFYKFADNCLFLLLFKNHGANVSGENTFDLFYVMETVMGPNDVWTSEETEETLPLRDLPIRDVMEHLISQELNGRAFSTVLSNFSVYIIQIHHHSLGDRLLKGIGIFLGKLAGLLDKRDDIDVSPVLDMVEKILREHPFAIAILTPSLKTLVKHAVESSSVNVESLARLLTVHNLIMLDQLANKFSIGSFLVDLMKLIYTGKTKLPTNGAATLIQVMLWDYYAATPGSAPSNLGFNQMAQAPTTNGYRTIFPGITDLFDDMVLFLGDPLKYQKYTGEEFKISIWTSHLIISMLEPRHRRFHELLCKQNNDQNLHLLNHVFLAIAHVGSPKHCSMAIELQDMITEILSHGVKLAASPESNDELFAAQRVVISQTFVLIKAWSILIHILNVDAKHLSANNGRGNTKRQGSTTMTAERRLWNTIWPMLKKTLLARTQNGNSNDLPLVWRHFFQLIAFLQGLGSEILLVYNHDWLSVVEIFFDEQEKLNNPVREIESQTKLLLDTVPTIHFSSELENIVENIYTELRQSSHFQVSPEANQLAIFFGQL